MADKIIESYPLAVILCGIVWSEAMCLSPTQATLPLRTSHLKLSLLAASQRDGPGWNTQRRSAHTNYMISICQTMCVSNAIYSPTSIIFLWNTLPISCLPITDCYHLFRMIIHNSGIEVSAWIDHIVFAAS
jgi:hypothetical protein